MSNTLTKNYLILKFAHREDPKDSLLLHLQKVNIGGEHEFILQHARLHAKEVNSEEAQDGDVYRALAY